MQRVMWQDCFERIMPLIVEVGVFTKKDLGAMGSAFMLAYGFDNLLME